MATLRSTYAESYVAADGGSSANKCSVASITTAPGDLIVAFSAWNYFANDTATATISDGVNTWTQKTGFAYSGGTPKGQWSYALATTSTSSLTVTQTMSADRTLRKLHVMVFTPGASTTLDFDTGSEANVQNYSNAPSCGTITYSAAGVVLCGFFEYDGSGETGWNTHPGTGWTQGVSGNAYTEYRLPGSSGTATGDLSATITEDGWGALGIAFKETVSNVRKIKLMAHSSAASATGIAGVVYSAPTGSNLVGATRYGEFTGKSFEAALENGQAVLKVSASVFGGGAIALGDKPVALVRNTVNTTGFCTTLAIDE